LESKNGSQGILSVEKTGPYLILHQAPTRDASLSVAGHGPYLQLSGDTNKERISLGVIADAPSLALTDGEGYRTKIGSIDLTTTRTGESHKTSAASLVMFGKDGKIIWRAP
jgi:hypothetical protein